MPPKVKKTYTRPASLASYRKAQEKKYGDRIIRKATRQALEFIPTGVTGLDLALGGGWARGRYHQIIGQPNTCKTSMVLIAMKNALDRWPDQGVVYLDVEKTVSEERFLAHGIDPDDDRLLWRSPASGEEVADMLRDDLRSGLFSMAAIDSVGAMEREDALYEKAASESVMGKAAQLLTRMSKQVTTISRETNTAAFIVNQYRKDFEGAFDKAAGPMIMGYMTTDSVAMRRLGGAENIVVVKEGGDDIEVAHKVVAKVERSKLRTQGAKAEFWYNKVAYDGAEVGIDVAAEAYDIGVKAGAIVPGKGYYWIFPDASTANGKAQSIAHLRDHPDLLEQVRVKSLENIANELTPEVDVEFDRVGE
jgi:recombination protein RecA